VALACGAVTSSAAAGPGVPLEIRQVRATPDRLWPPDGRMVPVVVAVTAVSAEDPAPRCEVRDVAVYDRESSTHMHADDWVLTGALSVSLRAARAESGLGRTYLLVVACTDTSGNTATRNLTVAVPYELREPKRGDRFPSESLRREQEPGTETEHDDIHEHDKRAHGDPGHDVLARHRTRDHHGCEHQSR
jgi:hypothetical protein